MDKRSGFLLFAIAMVTTALVGGCGKALDSAMLPPPTGAAPSGNATDSGVSARVKMALRQSESLKGFDIAVVTLKGDVQLSGALDNQAQIDDAIRIARTVGGAQSIHDQLTVKK